jgi:hypothetical protein
MADKWSDQIRACGLFFISIVVLMVIPLVYHCFVFLTAIPLWSVQPASCIILLVSFHILFFLLIMSYWKTIFTDAGGVPYELDEAWVSIAQGWLMCVLHKWMTRTEPAKTLAPPTLQISELNLANRFGLEAEVSERVSESTETSP